MELVRQWLTGVICAALIAALADGLMPKGAVRQVGKLVCALVLLCALLRPVLTVDIPDMSKGLGATAKQVEQHRAQLEQNSGNMLKTLIERQSAAYIVDKAVRIGLDCQVRVMCEEGEGGIWLPRSVSITGILDERQQAELTAAIQKEFGIAPECQVYTGGE
ncbi:MAG: hypothetical protein E7440_07100 [Ruminococcaceae bacterium]|nr:hypothetical protein [Oscillospiraceae bacterium]